MPPFVTLLIALAAALAAGPAAAASQLRMDRTSPDHLRPPTPPLSVPEVIPHRTRFLQPARLYTLPDGLAGLATVDETLSRLCRRGAFVQQTDGYFWAQTKDRRYGVALADGINLTDAQNRRQPGKVYFFENQDSSRCTVLVGDRQRLEPFRAGALSAPPAAR